MSRKGVRIEVGLTAWLVQLVQFRAEVVRAVDNATVGEFDAIGLAAHRRAGRATEDEVFRGFHAPTGCRELHPGQITATFTVDGEPPIVLEGTSLREWDQEVTADAARFVTEDYAFPEDSLRPVLISHDVHWLNSQLVGTGGASGDGDDLGCSWAVELVGIFVP